MDVKQFGGMVTGYKDKCQVLYFREGHTFRTSELVIKDACLILREKGAIVKAWGHSPGALLPVKGKNKMVQLVNARDGNPCDPFGCVEKKEKFTDASIKASAKEQHYKSMNVSSGTSASPMQWLIMGIATFLFLIVGITWAVNNWKW